MSPKNVKPSANAVPTCHAEEPDRARTGKQTTAAGMSGLQGEGNHGAARAFNEAERRFVDAGKVAAAARAAAPRTDAEEREMLAAEQKGKQRAKT